MTRAEKHQAIVRRFKAGESAEDLAKAFGVSVGGIMYHVSKKA